MTDLVMIEASLFQFTAALAGVHDEMFASQLKLTTSVLANAIAAARETMNLARVNDIEFALNDVAGVIGELSQADADQLAASLAMLRSDVEALKEGTALPASVLDEIHAFRHALRARQTAIERQTYVEGGAAPLPPADFVSEGTSVRTSLAAAGFETPALDAYLAAPQELRFHTIGEIIDELDAAASFG